jgi:hypothetical protein
LEQKATTTQDKKVTERKRMPYFAASEVAQHNTFNDCWLSFFNKVYDVSPLLVEHRSSKSFDCYLSEFVLKFSPFTLAGLLIEPLLKFAGQDITHWFDNKTKDVCCLCSLCACSGCVIHYLFLVV